MVSPEPTPSIRVASEFGYADSIAAGQPLFLNQPLEAFQRLYSKSTMYKNLYENIIIWVTRGPKRANKQVPMK